MPRVKVSDYGIIEFPDSLSPEDIQQRLQYDILPRLRGETPQRPMLQPDPTGRTDQIFANEFYENPTNDEIAGVQEMDAAARAQMIRHWRANKERLNQQAFARGQSRPLLREIADDMLRQAVGGQARGSGSLPEANRRLSRVAGLHANPDFQSLGKRNSRTAALLATMAANDNPAVPELFLRAASGKEQLPEYDIEDYDPSLLDSASHFLVGISSRERLAVARAGGAMSPLGVRKFAVATIRDAAIKNGMNADEAVALLQSPEVQKILAGAEQGAYGKALIDGRPLTMLLGGPLEEARIEATKKKIEPKIKRPLPEGVDFEDPGLRERMMAVVARGLNPQVTAKITRGILERHDPYYKGKGPVHMYIPGLGKFDMQQIAEEAHEPNWVEGIASGIVGIVADPINALTFKLGGALGSMPLAGRANALWKLGKTTGNKNMVRGATLMMRSSSGFGGLALFGAQQEALLNDEATLLSTLGAALKEGALGALLGPASMPGGSRAAGESVKRYLARNFAAFNLESLVFGVGSPFMHGELPTWQSIADGYGMIGGLKILHVIKGPSERAAKKKISEWTGEELRSAMISNQLMSEIGRTNEFMRRLEAEAGKDVVVDARKLLGVRDEVSASAGKAMTEVSRREKVRRKASEKVEPGLEADAVGWADDASNLLHHFQTRAIKKRRVSPTDTAFEEIAARVEGMGWSEGIREVRGEIISRWGATQWSDFLREQGYEVPGKVSMKGFRQGAHPSSRRAARRKLGERVDFETPAGTMKASRSQRIENLVAQGKVLAQEGESWFLGEASLESKIERDFAEHMRSYLEAKFESMPAEQLEAAARKFGLAEEVRRQRDETHERVLAEVEAEAMDLQAGPTPEVGLERRVPGRQERGMKAVERAARGEERRRAPERAEKAKVEPEAPTKPARRRERPGRRAGERRIGQKPPPPPPERREGERRTMMRRAGEQAIPELEEKLAKAKAGEAEEAIARDNLTGLPDGPEINERLAELAIKDAKEFGDTAVYVDTDLRNLGGMNEQLGWSEASVHLKKIIGIFERVVRDAFGDNAVLTRKGGDEFGLTVTGRSVEEVESVLEKMSKQVDAYLTEQGIKDLPRKTGDTGPPGVGLYSAAEEFDATRHKTAKKLIEEVEAELEGRKLEEKREQREPTKEIGYQPERPGREEARAVEQAAKPKEVEAPREEAPEVIEKPKPTKAEGKAAEETPTTRFAAAEMIAAHPRGAKISKDFAGNRVEEIGRQLEESLGRELNESERIWIEFFQDTSSTMLDMRSVSFSAEESFKGGPVGLDFGRAIRNGTAFPIGLRKQMAEAIELELGGLDVPRPEQVKLKAPPKKPKAPEAVAPRMASTDLARPSMNGVFFEKDGTVTATDGHSLISIKGGPTRDADQILRPGKGGGYADVIEGPFPPYKQVIPEKTKKITDISREQTADLLSYLKAIKKANPHKQLGVHGEDKFGVVITAADGKPQAFNGGLFTDMLQAIVDLGIESIRFSGTDPTSALLIKGKTPEGREAIQLIMPLKIEPDAKIDPRNTIDLRRMLETGKIEDIPRPPYGKQDLGIEGEGPTAGEAHYDKLYAFPGQLFDAESWRVIGESAHQAGAKLIEAGGPAAERAGQVVGAHTQALRWRLLGQEGVRVAEDPIRLNPSDWLRNQEDIIRQTPEGSEIIDANFKFKDDTAKNYQNAMDRMDKIRKDIVADLKGPRAKRRAFRRRWEKIIEGLESDKPAPEVAEHVEALRDWYDTLHKWAAKNKVAIGYRENYLSHFFNGDYWIKERGEYSRPFESWGEALKEFGRLRTQGRDVSLEMDTYVPPFEGQPTSRRGFFRASAEMRNLLGERIEVMGKDVENAEIGEMLKVMGENLETGEFAELLRGGKVLRPLPRHRHFGNALRRITNNPYFSRDPSVIFPNYAYGLVRKVTQEALLRKVQTQLENMPLEHSELKRYVMDYYMPATLGHPTRFEKAAANWFGRTIMGRPVEPGAIRNFVSSIAGTQFLFDLGASMVSAVVNMSQYWVNAYPVVGETASVRGEGMYWKSLVDKELMREIRDVAVTEQVSPITQRRIEHGAKQLLHPLGLFQEAEYANRVKSYFAGKHFAITKMDKAPLEGLVETMRNAAVKVTPLGTAQVKQLGPLFNMASEVETILNNARDGKHFRKTGKYHRSTLEAIEARKESFARQFGKQLSDVTQFRVGRENLPQILNNAPIKAIFPYKSFLINQVRLSYRYLRLHPDYRGGPLLRRQSWRRAGVWEDPMRWLKHSAMTFAVGGIFGSPFLLAGFHVLNAAYRKITGEDLRHELRKLHFERGLLSKLGLDLSGNFAVNLPNPNRFFEDTTGRAVKVIWHAIQFAPDGYDTFERRRLKRDLTPSQVRRIADAWKLYKSGEVVTPIRKELIDYVGGDTLDRAKAALRAAFGAQDPRIRASFDDREDLRKRQERFKRLRSDINERMAESIKQSDLKIIDGVVEDIIKGLTESLEKMEKAKSQHSYSQALDEFLFWYQSLEVTGEGFPNALERKFIPREVRGFGEYPSYMRYEAMVRQMERQGD